VQCTSSTVNNIFTTHFKYKNRTSKCDFVTTIFLIQAYSFNSLKIFTSLLKMYVLFAICFRTKFYVHFDMAILDIIDLNLAIISIIYD
jgi:hypothetical protein